MVKKRLSKKHDIFHCNICSRNLLDPLNIEQGVLIFQTVKKEKEEDLNYIYDVMTCCKDKCLSKLEHKLINSKLEIGGSEYVSDIIIPSYFLSWIKERMQRMYSSIDDYSVDAFAHLFEVIDRVSPFTFQSQTKRQKERMEAVELFK